VCIYIYIYIIFLLTIKHYFWRDDGVLRPKHVAFSPIINTGSCWRYLLNVSICVSTTGCFLLSFVLNNKTERTVCTGLLTESYVRDVKKTLSKAVHMRKIFTNRIQSCSLVKVTHELYPKLFVWRRYYTTCSQVFPKFFVSERYSQTLVKDV
jgi:hypothetical protein